MKRSASTAFYPDGRKSARIAESSHQASAPDLQEQNLGNDDVGLSNVVHFCEVYNHYLPFAKGSRANSETYRHATAVSETVESIQHIVEKAGTTCEEDRELEQRTSTFIQSAMSRPGVKSMLIFYVSIYSALM